jgi:hypothetical protein
LGFYDRYILPRLIDMACGARPMERQRAKVVPLSDWGVARID